jgi:hypothetical protein
MISQDDGAAGYESVNERHVGWMVVAAMAGELLSFGGDKRATMGLTLARRPPFDGLCKVKPKVAKVATSDKAKCPTLYSTLQLNLRAEGNLLVYFDHLDLRIIID